MRQRFMSAIHFGKSSGADGPRIWTPSIWMAGDCAANRSVMMNASRTLLTAFLHWAEAQYRRGTNQTDTSAIIAINAEPLISKNPDGWSVCGNRLSPFMPDPYTEKTILNGSRPM
jgi:hypothetical protein